MPTIAQHTEVLKKIRENPSLIGITPEGAAMFIEDYEANLGKALLDLMEQLVPAFGSVELDSEMLVMDYDRLLAAVTKAPAGPAS